MHRAFPIFQRSIFQWLAPVVRWLSVPLLALAIAILPLTCLGSGAAIAAISHAPENARAYLLAPSDGQTVPQEFEVKFGLSAMEIAPAGTDKDGTGHHHLLIDVETLPTLTEPLPATAQIKHFGGGQTETMLTLPPGEHTLQLLLGNYNHIPHDNPVLSEKVSITVR